MDFSEHQKYFRKSNVNDPDFEAKKRKIFKALYQIQKELEDKKTERQPKEGSSAVIEDKEQQNIDKFLKYHDEENFFNNVFFNH